jgi:DNA-binding FadR family transcriptional regulator
MKIEGPSGPKSTGPVKKTGSSTASPSDAAEFRGMMEGGAAEAAAVNTTQQIASLDILLAVQSVEDPGARAARGRAAKRSGELLDALDKIRNNMLAGTLTVGHMIDIADVVASHRDRIQDPQLTGVLDEIDLRAQVEIAKMRLALDDVQGSAGAR